MQSRALRVLPGLILLVSAACAAGLQSGPATPDQIAALEDRARTAPRDADAWTRLGIAYGSAGRGDEAREALDRAVALPDPPAAAWAHAGLWREDAGDLEGAAAAYRTYLETGGPASSEVEARLARVDRGLLTERARASIAREAEISAEPADPASVGVLPLTVEGPPEYEPLGVGLAELLTTDLSITGRLSVLERAQLSALVDEMRLALGGFTDAASAARAGRLLRAGRVVQGRIVIAEVDGETQVLALVVDAADPSSPGEVRERGGLETLMEMEVQLALSIYRELGIELTAAERARLEEKPTRNLQAFLAYSEGLQLMDGGDYRGAAARFEAAAALDPDFSAAAAAAERATRIGAVTPGDVQRSAGGEPGQFASVAGSGGAMEALVDAMVPAGTAVTATGSSGPSPDQTLTVETTEITAGTGIGQVIRIPIVLVRPVPYLLPWRLP